MNARRPQEIQHERQEAPAGPKLSARRLQEASQNELTQKPPGAVGSRQEPPGAVGSRQEVSGAARSCQEPARSRQGAVPEWAVAPSRGLGHFLERKTL